MLKRMIPLLLVLGAFVAAPAAMAECYRCKIRSLPHTEPPQCIVVTLGPKFAECIEDFENDTCILTGTCSTLAASAQPGPLAAQYAVASVQRLDEPQLAAAPALTAAATNVPLAR
jgi:hypothetical protein